MLLRGLPDYVLEEQRYSARGQEHLQDWRWADRECQGETRIAGGRSRTCTRDGKHRHVRFYWILLLGLGYQPVYPHSIRFIRWDDGPSISRNHRIILPGFRICRYTKQCRVYMTWFNRLPICIGEVPAQHVVSRDGPLYYRPSNERLPSGRFQ